MSCLSSLQLAVYMHIYSVHFSQVVKMKILGLGGDWKSILTYSKE